MTQIQLSDAQAVILSTACAREDAIENGNAKVSHGSGVIISLRAA